MSQLEGEPGQSSNSLMSSNPSQIVFTKADVERLISQASDRISFAKAQVDDSEEGNSKKGKLKAPVWAR